MGKFYDGTRLVNSLDKNGEKPELFICCSRVRGPGKSFWFSRMLLKRFFDSDKKDKFVLLCRTKLEVGALAAGVFKAMMAIEFPGWDIYEKTQMKGVYSNIYISRGGEGDEKEVYHVGYVVPLNACDNLKRISSNFSDSVHAFFDEFQPEDKNTYLSDEVSKFLSVHTSLARGGGESRRYYPVYMCSNTVSIINPYFVALGLNKCLQSNSKFFKGDGFVFEKCENPGLVQVHAESGMARAFNQEKYIDYGDNSWLNDSMACIERPGAEWGRSYYDCTLISGDVKLGVHYYGNMMLYYIDYNVDVNSGLVFNIKYDNMEPNIPLIRGSLKMAKLRESMEKGIVRFRDLRCKSICMDLFI